MKRSVTWRVSLSSRPDTRDFAVRSVRGLAELDRGRKKSFGIARLQHEIRAFAGAASDQLKQPSGTTDAGRRKRRRR
jgi:hypothetical protein